VALAAAPFGAHGPFSDWGIIRRRLRSPILSQIDRPSIANCFAMFSSGVRLGSAAEITSAHRIRPLTAACAHPERRHG
jgi:hypothetical protein